MMKVKEKTKTHADNSSDSKIPEDGSNQDTKQWTYGRARPPIEKLSRREPLYEPFYTMFCSAFFHSNYCVMNDIDVILFSTCLCQRIHGTDGTLDFFFIMT